MVFCFGLRVSKATTVSLFCLKLFDIFCDFSISVRLVGMVYEGRLWGILFRVLARVLARDGLGMGYGWARDRLGMG